MILDHENFYFLFYCFMIYAFIGWLLEITFHLIKLHKFVNRGFLYGPLCPIYGVGAVLALLTLEPFKGKIFALYVGGFILGSLVEFVVGFLLEIIFKTRWWDYKDEGPNIYGYVCLKFSLLWGVLAVVFIQIIHPGVSTLMSTIPGKAGEVIYQALLIILVVDVTATVNNLIQFRKFFNELHDISQELKANLEAVKEKALNGTLIAGLEHRNAYLKGLFERLTGKINFKHRHFLKAYPGITSKRFGSLFDEVKMKLLESRRNRINRGM